MGHQAASRKSDFHTVGWSPLAHSIQYPALLGKHRNILPRAWQNTQAQQLESLCNKVPFFTPIPVLLLVHKHLCEVLYQHQASFPSWTDGFSPCAVTASALWEKRGQHWATPLPWQWGAAAGSGREQQSRKPQAVRPTTERTQLQLAVLEKSSSWNQVCLSKCLCLGSPVAPSCTSNCLWCWEGVTLLSCLWELPLLHGRLEWWILLIVLSSRDL